MTPEMRRGVTDRTADFKAAGSMQDGMRGMADNLAASLMHSAYENASVI